MRGADQRPRNAHDRRTAALHGHPGRALGPGASLLRVECRSARRGSGGGRVLARPAEAGHVDRVCEDPGHAERAGNAGGDQCDGEGRVLCISLSSLRWKRGF